MHSNIGRITVLETDETGATTVVVLDRGQKKRKKKSSSLLLSIPETIIRQGLDAGAEAAEELRKSHRLSNEKRTDGWLRDLGKNVFKAVSKGRKKIKMSRWISSK